MSIRLPLNKCIFRCILTKYIRVTGALKLHSQWLWWWWWEYNSVECDWMTILAHVVLFCTKQFFFLSFLQNLKLIKYSNYRIYWFALNVSVLISWFCILRPFHMVPLLISAFWARLASFFSWRSFKNKSQIIHKNTGRLRFIYIWYILFFFLLLFLFGRHIQMANVTEFQTTRNMYNNIRLCKFMWKKEEIEYFHSAWNWTLKAREKENWYRPFIKLYIILLFNILKINDIHLAWSLSPSSINYCLPG